MPYKRVFSNVKNTSVVVRYALMDGTHRCHENLRTRSSAIDCHGIDQDRKKMFLPIFDAWPRWHQ